jgi:RNA polymerase sigma-B factor
MPAARLQERTSARTTGALELELDTWEAATTVPVQARPRSWPMLHPTTVPAVDPALWLVHVRWFRRRLPEAHHTLLGHYERHARHLARRAYRGRESLEDLEQVAVEGLLHALDRFDPRRRIPFLGFAVPTISGALKKHYRDAGWGIRVPRRAHELAGSISGAVDALQQDLGREPVIEEIADFLDAPVGDVMAAMQATGARNVASVDALAVADGSTRSLGAEDRAFGLLDDRIALDQITALLEPADRDLLHRYYVMEMSQDQIAADLGVSQMQVSRMLSRVLRRLRSHLPN